MANRPKERGFADPIQCCWLRRIFGNGGLHGGLSGSAPLSSAETDSFFLVSSWE